MQGVQVDLRLAQTPYLCLWAKRMRAGKEEEPDRSHLPALSSTPRWYACSMGCVSAAGYTRALKAGEACLGSTQLESDAHRHV